MTATSIENRELDLSPFAKTAIYYEKEIFPKVNHLRGTTRLRNFLRYFAVDPISNRKTNHQNSGFKVDKLDCRVVDRNDAKYFFWENRYAKRLIKETEGKTVFCDVGAYHGFYSVANRSEKTYTFEANPRNADRISENIEANPNKDISLVEKAVWNKNTKLCFEMDDSTSVVSDDGEKVEAVSLDNFFQNRRNPDVIKIDVEGAEGKVLEGAEKVLETSHPTIFIEIHLDGRTDGFGFSKEDIVSILQSHGYSTVFSEKRGREKLVIAK